jgi:hypothetical protein
LGEIDMASRCDCSGGCEFCEYTQGIDCPYDDEEEPWREEKVDIAEAGVCLSCGQPYEKTIGESNVSRTGFCYSCGFNP